MSIENFSYTGRIQNFLQFKGILCNQTSKNSEISGFLEATQSSAQSAKTLRDIEFLQPFPIGFIGPIEAIFQWSTMILTAYDELSQEIIDSVAEQIEEKVEDEYFVMGPTFSVADCVLLSDLKEIQKKFHLSPPVEEYMTRVQNFLDNQSSHT